MGKRIPSHGLKMKLQGGDIDERFRGCDMKYSQDCDMRGRLQNRGMKGWLQSRDMRRKMWNYGRN